MDADRFDALDPSLGMLVLEQEVAGFGASGRNDAPDPSTMMRIARRIANRVPISRSRTAPWIHNRRPSRQLRPGCAHSRRWKSALIGRPHRMMPMAPGL